GRPPRQSSRGRGRAAALSGAAGAAAPGGTSSRREWSHSERRRQGTVHARVWSAFAPGGQRRSAAAGGSAGSTSSTSTGSGPPPAPTFDHGSSVTRSEKNPQIARATASSG